MSKYKHRTMVGAHRKYVKSKGCYMKLPRGASMKYIHTLGEKEGAGNYADKNAQGDGGSLALIGHPFQCSLCKRE